MRPRRRLGRPRLDRMRKVIAEKRGEDRAPEKMEHPGDPEPIDHRTAHELKQPLSAMKALVQLGLRNPAECASHGRLAVLEREIARALRILQGGQSLARVPGEPTQAPG